MVTTSFPQWLKQADDSTCPPGTLLISRNWFTAPSLFHVENFSFIEARNLVQLFVRGIFWASVFCLLFFFFPLQMCEMLVSQENQAIFGLLKCDSMVPMLDWILFNVLFSLKINASVILRNTSFIMLHFLYYSVSFHALLVIILAWYMCVFVFTLQILHISR